MCLHLGNICDGYADCPLSDDEMRCQLKSVDCPSYCICLLYAIDCRSFSDENLNIIYSNELSYLFVHLSKFRHISIKNLINLLKYAVVIKLPENKISSICDSFIKFRRWKCMILDLSLNLLKSLNNKCFQQQQFLNSLKVNDNHIKSIEKLCFQNSYKIKIPQYNE